MFYEDLARGKVGESYVKDLMEHRKHKVKDVSDIPSLGFDFYISNKKVELKTDYVMNRTNNLFLEDCCEYKRGGGRAGWLRTCKADYLFYLDEKDYTLYIYLLDEIRNYVKENKDTIPYRSLDDGNKRVFGYCLNKDLVRNQVIRKNEVCRNEKQN